MFYVCSWYVSNRKPVYEADSVGLQAGVCGGLYGGSSARSSLMSRSPRPASTASLKMSSTTVFIAECSRPSCRSISTMYLLRRREEGRGEEMARCIYIHTQYSYQKRCRIRISVYTIHHLVFARITLCPRFNRTAQQDSRYTLVLSLPCSSRLFARSFPSSLPSFR